MSHFTVLVVGDDIESALAPYDEDIEVAPYREPFNADEEYARARKWAEGDGRDRTPANLDLDDRAAVFAWFFDDEGVTQENGEWVKYSTYNPKSKWDWYTVGGRWDGGLITKDGKRLNECTVGDLDFDATNATYAVLRDDQWAARGEMGWFGFSRDAVSEDEWPALWRKHVAELPPETRVTLVDAHI